jgi:hypothetical protein
MKPLPSRRPLRNSRCHALVAERTEMTWILGIILGNGAHQLKRNRRPWSTPTFMKSSAAFAPMALSKFWPANAKLRLISRSCMSAGTSHAGSPDFPILNATPTSCLFQRFIRPGDIIPRCRNQYLPHRCAGARLWGCARSLRRARRHLPRDSGRIADARQQFAVARDQRPDRRTRRVDEDVAIGFSENARDVRMYSVESFQSEKLSLCSST